MNPIKSLMGRRQFLIATGMASTCALTCKKLSGFINPGFQTSAALAADKAATAGVISTTNKYPNLLSPLRIRNVVLKNRILHTPSPPHSMQGPENYPADSYRNHYSNMAKNAAIVTIVEHWGTYPKTYGTGEFNLPGPSHYSDSSWEDIPPVHNYFRRLIEDIHCEGSLVAGANIGGAFGGGTSAGTGWGGEAPGAAASGGSAPGATGRGGPSPQAQASVSIEDIVTQAKKIEDIGYDVVGIGGQLRDKDSMATAIEQMQAVRNATNLLIMAFIRPYTPGLSRGEPYTPGLSTGEQPTGPELEEVVAMAKMLEGSADMIRMKDAGHATAHPNSFTMEKGKPWMIRFARAIKESGNKIITCPTGGFHEPEISEEFISTGKTDMIGMATPLFADPEYVKKLFEDRAEDIVPCVRCHDCHGVSRTKGPWYEVCTVNPKYGLPIYKSLSINAPTMSKKVAVIGGGPAGMKAAIVAAERGHKVTLYEKSNSLGGLLKYTDFTQWKWAHKDFKDYLIRQVKKAGIEVHLKTTATPEMIKSKGYDTVLVATGAEPVISKIPGADGDNVFNILSAYSNKKNLGKNVVIIGASLFGTEAGIGLAKDGHKVTVLTSEKEMIPEEFVGPHNLMNQIDIYQNHPNFSYILEATAKNISGGKVTYVDAKGDEKTIQADSVVIYAGLKPMMDEAMNFSGSAGQVLLLGDCTGKNGTIQKTIRSAFFAASQV